MLPCLGTWRVSIHQPPIGYNPLTPNLQIRVWLRPPLQTSSGCTSVSATLSGSFLLKSDFCFSSAIFFFPNDPSCSQAWQHFWGGGVTHYLWWCRRAFRYKDIVAARKRVGRRERDRRRDSSHSRLTGLRTMEVEEPLYWKFVLSMCWVLNIRVINFTLYAHTKCSRSGANHHYSLKKQTITAVPHTRFWHLRLDNEGQVKCPMHAVKEWRNWCIFSSQGDYSSSPYLLSFWDQSPRK